MLLAFIKLNSYILTIIIICVALFLTLPIIICVVNYREKKNIKEIQNQSNTVRVFIIDYNRRSVRYFNKSDLKNKKVISFFAFLEQFVGEERSKIQTWVEDLLDSKKNTPQYLECDVIINKKRKSYFSFLQVQKIDLKKKIIHIESYLMKYLVPKSKSNKKKFTRYDLSYAQMQDLYSSSKHKNRGACLLIQIFKSHVQVELSDKIDNLIITQLKNVIYPFLGNGRYLTRAGDNVFVIYDFKINSRRDIMQLAHTFQKVLQKYVVINSFDGNYEFSIGICEFKNGDGTLKNILSKAKTASILAHSKEDPIVLYDADLKLEEVNEVSFESEVNNIVKNKELVYLFRPIANIKRGNIFGYYTRITSLNQMFIDIDDIKDYSYKSGQSKELFSLLSRNIIPRFISEKGNSSVRLFYRIAASELDYVLKSLNRISGIKDSKIVLMLDEVEIYYWKLESLGLDEKIDNFKKYGYEVALCLKENDFVLTEETLKLFDFFVFDESLTKGLKNNSRMRLSLNSLYERLEPFGKPVVAVDMEFWNEIELVAKMGINYISSDIISPWNEMLVPIEKKKMIKVKALGALNKD